MPAGRDEHRVEAPRGDHVGLRAAAVPVREPVEERLGGRQQGDQGGRRAGAAGRRGKQERA